MSCTRRDLAHKTGLTYDLLRHYEKTLANVLRLTRGSNGEMLFDDAAQAVILEAVRLKRERGYSMKQLFQHFNQSPTASVGDHLPLAPDLVPVPVPVPASSPLPLPIPCPPPDFAAAVQQFHAAVQSLSDRVASVSAPDFAERLATHVEARLSGRLQDAESRTDAIVARARALEDACCRLAERVGALESGLAAERSRPRSLAERIVRFMFGLQPKGDEAPAPVPAGAVAVTAPGTPCFPLPAPSRAEPAPPAPTEFARYFERFVTAPGTRKDGSWYLGFLGAGGRPDER